MIRRAWSMCPPQNGQYGCDTHHPLCSGHSFSTRGTPGWHFVWKKERPQELAQSSTQMHMPDMRSFVTVNIGHKPTTHNFRWCPDAQVHPTWPPSFNLSSTRSTPGYPGTPEDIYRYSCTYIGISYIYIRATPKYSALVHT